jgi:predicted ATP-grasp superfamily ATP-dependent carboligase
VRPTRAGTAGKAVLFATEDVVAGDLRGVRDVPHPGERIAAGRPICTIVTTADDPLADLEARAARLRAQLRSEVPA